MSAAGDRAPRVARDAALVFVVAFAALFALRQHTIYSVDAHSLLLTARDGLAVHKYHFAYLPLLWLAGRLGALVGATVHDAGATLSAAGVAAGIAWAHVANRRLIADRTSALAATALFATAPAVVFFGTVVEVHGPFLGCCGPAFVAIAAVAVRPSLAAGALFGLATALAYAGHATGAVLPMMALPVAAVLARERGASWRTIARCLPVATLVHGLLVVGIPLLVRALAAHPTPFGEELGWLARSVTPAGLLHAAWCDWLRPFLPLSLLGVAALVPRRTRALAVALTAAVVGYVVLTVLLTGEDSEHGAYVLPLAWPAALVAARLVPRLALPAAILGGAALAVVDVARHDTREQLPFAEGYAEVIEDRPAFVIAGGHCEVAAFLLDLPHADWHVPIVELQTPASFFAAGLAHYDRWLEDRTAGRELWITTGGVATLAQDAWTRGRPAGPRLLAHLHERFRWVAHEAKGFRAFRLLPAGGDAAGPVGGTGAVAPAPGARGR